MILYKFRSLQNIEFALDIILNERLHCASYSELNDPFEGLFYSYSIVSGFTLPAPLPINLGPQKVRRQRTAADLYANIEHSKICSLSKSLNDVRLWSHYADSHRGIAIEIDFSETQKDLYKVEYAKELPEYGSTILTEPAITEVLSRKTFHWKHEKEYRIIQAETYYPIIGKIKSIYTGHRITEMNSMLLKKVVPNHVPIIPTEINPEKVIIQAKKLSE